MRRLSEAMRAISPRPPRIAGAYALPTRARAAAVQLRRSWLRMIGAPDYEAYLAHLAEHHPGAEPMSERDYVAMFIERRYNGPGAGRCC